MKRLIALLLFLCLSISLLVPLGVGATQPDEDPPAIYTMTQVSTAPGIVLRGEETVTISTTEELLAFAAYVSSGKPTAGILFRLEATITLNKGKFNTDGRWFELDGATQKKGDPSPFVPIGHTGGEPIPFLGILDGNGYHINGLYIDMEAKSLGFFALLGPGAVLRDLSFRNGYVGSSAPTVGVLAGRAEGTPDAPVLIDGCRNMSHVETDGAAGGVVGTAHYTTLANCSNEGWITGGDYAGGIVALAAAGTEIYTASNMQVVRCPSITGGIAARLSSGTTLQNSLNVAYLAGNEQKGAIVGKVAADATVAGCYYKEDTSDRGIGGTAANDPALTAPKTEQQLKSLVLVIEMNTFHLTSPRIRALCHPWQRGSDYPGIGTSPTVAIVTEGETVFGAGSLANAASMCSSGATVRLFDHVTDMGGDISGTYTLDLNGYTVTLLTPLLIKGGIVTLTDTAPTDHPAGKLLAPDNDAVRLTGGSLRILAGTIVSNSDYAIRCDGIGTLQLPTNPQIIGGAADIYLRYANCLVGGGPVPSGDTEYVGAGPVALVCGWNLSEGDIVAQNATLKEYELQQLPPGTSVVESEGGLVVSKTAAHSNSAMIFATATITALALLILTFILSKKLRKAAKK
ncbi:MAG: hypothetical protein IJY16_03195 [Clostridia bacterium]|nr:hypothetical protein [Clostridia bacterium]